MHPDVWIGGAVGISVVLDVRPAEDTQVDVRGESCHPNMADPVVQLLIPGR